MKTVFFATGGVSEAAREIAELSGGLTAGSLRVVAPAALAKELRAATGAEILVYRPSAIPLLLLRLWAFLRWEAAEVVCLSPGPSYRTLKLVAYGLRGRVEFIRPDRRRTRRGLVEVTNLRGRVKFIRPDRGRVRLGLGAFLWVCASRLWARENGVVLVGSASPETLARLEGDLRRRRPGSPIYVLGKLSVAEFARLALQWRRFRYLSIPWTAEGHNLLKLAAWLLPCGRREIANEHGDSFSVRRVGVMARHVWWRLVDGWWRLWRRLWKLPPGVTVLGSASSYYLKDIVADLRRRHPGEPICGLLPQRLVIPAGALFDSVIPLGPFSPATWSALLRRCLGRARAGWYVIPCTNEGFRWIKLTCWLLPCGRREIYNENHDGFLLRSWAVVARHVVWRLRPRLFYQAVTERGGRLWPLHVIHLIVYPFRLLAGAGLLAVVRLRSLWLRPPVTAATPQRQPLPPAAFEPQAEEAERKGDLVI